MCRHHHAPRKGAAREMARMMTPQEMTLGGVRNDIAVVPVTLLPSGLHSRFAALEEESRLTSMTEMLGFYRRPSEGVEILRISVHILCCYTVLLIALFTDISSCSRRTLSEG